MAIVIIEGLTGAGKSSTIAALQEVGAKVAFDEDATFGEYMNEWLSNPQMPVELRARRLLHVLDSVSNPTRRSDPGVHIIERFHLSYYAIDGEWSFYDLIDERASELGITLALLDFSDDCVPARSLYRNEYGGADWQSLINIYGSEELALQALRLSQHRRREALTRTRIRNVVINTEQMAWCEYAKTIQQFAFDN